MLWLWAVGCGLCACVSVSTCVGHGRIGDSGRHPCDDPLLHCAILRAQSLGGRIVGVFHCARRTTNTALGSSNFVAQSQTFILVWYAGTLGPLNCSYHPSCLRAHVGAQASIIKLKVDTSGFRPKVVCRHGGSSASTTSPSFAPSSEPGSLQPNLKMSVLPANNVDRPRPELFARQRPNSMLLASATYASILFVPSHVVVHVLNIADKHQNEESEQVVWTNFQQVALLKEESRVPTENQVQGDDNGPTKTHFHKKIKPTARRQKITHRCCRTGQKENGCTSL